MNCAVYSNFKVLNKKKQTVSTKYKVLNPFELFLEIVDYFTQKMKLCYKLGYIIKKYHNSWILFWLSLNIHILYYKLYNLPGFMLKKKLYLYGYIILLFIIMHLSFDPFDKLNIIIQFQFIKEY